MLCSLNNFDAYIVTRVNKALKPFVFAVKSTDNLSYFESTADYVHVFSCGEQEGQNWLEKILLARVSGDLVHIRLNTHPDFSLISFIKTTSFCQVALHLLWELRCPAQVLANDLLSPSSTLAGPSHPNRRL